MLRLGWHKLLSLSPDDTTEIFSLHVAIFWCSNNFRLCPGRSKVQAQSAGDCGDSLQGCLHQDHLFTTSKKRQGNFWEARSVRSGMAHWRERSNRTDDNKEHSDQRYLAESRNLFLIYHSSKRWLDYNY